MPQFNVGGRLVTANSADEAVRLFQEEFQGNNDPAFFGMPPAGGVPGPGPTPTGSDPVELVLAQLEKGDLGQGPSALQQALQLLTGILGSAVQAQRRLNERVSTSVGLQRLLGAPPVPSNPPGAVPGPGQVPTAQPQPVTPPSGGVTTQVAPGQGLPHMNAAEVAQAGGTAGIPELDNIARSGQFGSIAAPWSETPFERRTTWNAAMGDAFGRVPGFLQGKFQDDGMAPAADAAFQTMRGLEMMPLTQSYSSFLSNPPSFDWRNLIDRAVQNLGTNFTPEFGSAANAGLSPLPAGVEGPFGPPGAPTAANAGFSPLPAGVEGPFGVPGAQAAGGGGLSNLGGAFQDILTNDQGLQLQLALASVMPKIPLMFADAMRNVAGRVFAQRMLSLPQGVPDADPMQTNFLPWFRNNNFSFVRQ